MYVLTTDATLELYIVLGLVFNASERITVCVHTYRLVVMYRLCWTDSCLK